MDHIVGRDGEDPLAVASGDDRVRRYDQRRLDGLQAHADLSEHTGEQFAVLIGNLHLCLQGARGGVERAGNTGDLTRENSIGKFVQ